MPSKTLEKPPKSKLNGWPGPKSIALFEEEQKYIAPGNQTIALLSKLTVESGKGCRLTDADGNSYLDFNVGVSVGSLGYSHPKYVKALADQLSKVTFGSYTSRARLALVKLIGQIAPKGLRRTQLFSSGAEAVEAAFRLAKSVTKRKQIFGFWGGFHGKTLGTLPLSLVDWKHEVGPFPPGYHQVMYADCYRCPLALKHPSCALACAEQLRQGIRETAKGDVAAVIAEPIQGTAGNIVPPDGYIRAIRDIAKAEGAVYISDEMITGFGRTGTWFGVDHDGVVPDVMTVGKSMGSGFPVSGVITSDEYAQAKPWAKPSASSSSYGGNPLASAAVLVTAQTILDEKLVSNSARVGKILLEGLKELQNKYEFIGDVRGRGLLVGMDLVKDRKTKEFLPKALCEKFFLEGLKRGLIMMSYTPRVRIHPPLILSADEAKEGLAKMDEAFATIKDDYESL
jgi:4-aminobutyrate aminotransferase / (S)-3-amino-2-methylpropionate transaminase / 5-aminovalerate transaminase